MNDSELAQALTIVVIAAGAQLAVLETAGRVEAAGDVREALATVAPFLELISR